MNPEEISGESEDAEGQKHAKSFLGHLEDLRVAILLSACALLAGMLIAVPLAPRIMGLIENTVTMSGVEGISPSTFLRFIKLGSGLTMVMKIGFWGGLIISLPVILIFVARFVFPGLTQRERRCVSYSMFFAGGLFVTGVLVGYFTSIPLVIRMMFGINAWLGCQCEFVEITDYVSLILELLLVFGLVFELPVVIVALGSLGIVSSRQLRDKRRHMIVILMVVAMFLTPPDPLSLVLMSIPMIALYEACIWIVWYRERAVLRRSAEI